MNGSFVSPALRERVRGLAIPVARGLGRLGLTPNALTLIGFLGTCVAAGAAAGQWWLAAGILVLVFGIFDLFDGTLARATGRATKLGAFFDSTFDRAGEAVVYVGIAIGCVAGGFGVGAVLAASAMGAASMVSYTRAKAESLGFASGTGMANVGFAPREVRVAILSVGLIVTALTAGISSVGAQVLAGTLGLITVLATLTTIQRILSARAQSREG